jgi:phosphatidylinositol kinase/protein kinase (PI-3  family)
LRVKLGDNLQNVILKDSSDCNDWMQRPINYTTSLAMTGFAGYILGLGECHICNTMIKNRTVKLVHIDFSVDIAINREIYREKVPFRLTMVIVSVLEVSGIEGTFKNCRENVMQLLKDSAAEILAFLDA